MRKILYLFIGIFLSISSIKSQEPVSFTTSVNPISENKYELITTSNIEKNWRLYSQYLTDGGAIPTEFTFKNEDPNSFNLIGKMIESESITKFDPIFQLDQSYFINSNTFKQVIEINNSEISKVFANIIFQACDDSLCIFRESELVFNLDGTSESIKNEDLTTLITDESNPLVFNLKNTELLETYSSDQSISGNNYIDLLILGFLGGLLALLTPCVFPMIPLTVSFFTNKESKSNSSFNAVIYGLFIVLIYLCLSIPFHFVESLDPSLLSCLLFNKIDSFSFLTHISS